MDKGKRSTLKTIAEKVGVSVTTVSRVLSGQAKRYRISKATEEAICRAAEVLHYAPNHLARGLRLKRTHTIGLLIPDISNPFFALIARSVEMEARKVGYSIMLCDTQESIKLEVDSIQLLQSRKVDGLIICPVGQDGNHLEQLYNNGASMVIVDRYFPQLKCPYVISDNYKGAIDAVNHFIENDHRIIACIQGLLHTSTNDDRICGYKDAHKMHNIPVDESLIVGNSFGERNGYVGAKLLLNRVSKPTAIFAVSNLISLGALRAIAEEGLKIPEDISIISFDDQPYSDYLSTPMTTVAQQNIEMGQIAVKLIIDQIEFKKHPDTNCVILPTKLIRRKSVKKLVPIAKEEEENGGIGKVENVYN
ncbi:MAG: LacI family DNA-binding transcriptional regulator [bacterium]